MRIARLDLTAPLDIEFTGALGERPAVYSFQPQPDAPGVFAADVTDPIVIKRLLSLDGFALLDVEAATGQTVWDVATALEVISAQLGRTVTLHDLHEAFDVPWPEPQASAPAPDTDPQPEPAQQPIDASAPQVTHFEEALDGEMPETPTGEEERLLADSGLGEKLVDEAREARTIAPELREPATLSEGRTAYKAMFRKAASPRFTFQQIKEALAKGPGSQE